MPTTLDSNTRQPFVDLCWPIKFPKGTRPITERSEYRRQRSLILACTQLPPPYTAKDQKRIVGEWCEFFRAPSPVRDLSLVSRTPIELFDAVCAGGSIERLHVKWGPVTDLSPITQLKNLDALNLGTTGVKDLSPLTKLPKLTHLALDNLKLVHDFAALSDASNLEFLYIEGYPQGPQKIRIKNLNFLGRLKRLRALKIGYAIIEDFDVAPLLELERLEYLDLPDSRRGPTDYERLDAWAATLREALPRLKYGNVATHAR